MRRALVSLVVLVGGFAGLLSLGERDVGPFVVTHEGERKIIFRLGEPRKVTEPGLTLRIPIPFIEEVRTYERRLLYLDAEPREIQTRDAERIKVDNYVVWRIADAVQFIRSFPQGTTQAEDQLDRIIRADVREVIGRHTLSQVLTEERIEIMRAIATASNEELGKDGIEVVDVRINRTELPQATERNVYERMKAERERLAKKYRAEGEENARRIRAEADREARVIVARAQRDAEITKGLGEAEATRVYAEAYSTDPGFYDFQRSLEAYRKTLGEGTTLVLSPRSEFFRFLGSGSPSRDRGPERESP